jgi:hypothetical protein
MGAATTTGKKRRERKRKEASKKGRKQRVLENGERGWAGERRGKN